MLAARPPTRIVEASTNFPRTLAPSPQSAYGRHVEALLLDRDAELEALERQLRDVRAGAGQVVAVEGPAGIGKSSLLRAAARTGEAQGSRSCGRAATRSTRTPAGHRAPAVEPLRSPRLERPHGRRGGALAARARPAPEPAPAADAVHAAVHGLVWLSCTLADRGPALLVVDDVHWADAASLRCGSAQLSRRLDQQPLGVLCAVRTGEPPGERELLAELLASVTEPTLRTAAARPRRRRNLVADRLPAAEPGLRTCLSRGHRRQSVPAPGADRASRRQSASPPTRPRPSG